MNTLQDGPLLQVVNLSAINLQDDLRFHVLAERQPNLPFFVGRTKNHMVPVYLDLEAIRGQRKITMIKHIEGDIWVSSSLKRFIVLNQQL